jgi:protein phosphatase
MVVPDEPVTVRWQAAVLSDRGRTHARNEDSYLVLPASQLYVVADGMGGHAAGDVASRTAVHSLAAAFERAPSPRITSATLSRRLCAAFEAANDALIAHADAHRECAGMGTTLTALATLRSAPQCVITHIGDSRAYRMRAGALTQLTVDHTWVQQQVAAGMLTRAEARHHPYSPVLTRVLGAADLSSPDTFVIDVAPGDLFLLCSDGLTGMIEDEDLATMLARDVPLEQHARELIDAANLRGGHDNITALLLRADQEEL